MALRLRVDPIACDGYGHCAEIAGELVTLDEWGYPIISDEVPRRLVEVAELAVRQFPRKALFLEKFEPRR